MIVKMTKKPRQYQDDSRESLVGHLFIVVSCSLTLEPFWTLWTCFKLV